MAILESGWPELRQQEPLSDTQMSHVHDTLRFISCY